MTDRTFACRFCRHDQSKGHNLVNGCIWCWCAATPGEAMPRTDVELGAVILPPGQYLAKYAPKEKDEDDTTTDSTFMSVLRILHRKSGTPSTRSIAAATGDEVSHTTVADVLRGTTFPRWPTAVVIVRALGGDVDEMRTLWLREHDARSVTVVLTPDPEDIKTVNEAWKHVECHHFKDPTTACLDCQASAVLVALHQAGWRKTR